MVLVLAIVSIALAILIPLLFVTFMNRNVLRPKYPTRRPKLMVGDTQTEEVPGIAKMSLEMLRGPNNVVPVKKARRNLVFEFAPDTNSIRCVVFLVDKKNINTGKVRDAVYIDLKQTDFTYNLPLPTWVAGLTLVVLSLNGSEITQFPPYGLSNGQKVFAGFVSGLGFGFTPICVFFAATFFYYGVRGATMDNFSIGQIFGYNYVLILLPSAAAAIAAFVFTLVFIRQKQAKKGALHG